MADQWEIDTLTAINKMRKNLAKLLWDDALEKESRDYTENISTWETITKIPPSITKLATCRGKSITYHQSRGGQDLITGHSHERGDYSDDKYDYHFEYDVDFLYSAGIITKCLRKPKYIECYETFSYWDKPKGFANHVMCLCRCPHWTPPLRIAGLLYDKQLINVPFRYGAVTIHNDDSFSYVSLACEYLYK